MPGELDDGSISSISKNKGPSFHDMYFAINYQLTTMGEIKEKPEDILTASLKVSDASFDSVVINSPDGVIVTNDEGFITFVNPAGEAMFGYSQEFLLGKSFGYTVLSGDVAEIEVLQMGKQSTVAEMRVVEFEWNGKPGLLATLRDVSERVKLCKELEQSNKQLEEITAVVSNDIRAPLRNLHLLAGWLQEDHAGDLNEDAMEDILLIRKTTSRMQRMVENLLTYSKVSFQRKLTPQVDLDDVLIDALDNLQEQIFESDAQFTHCPLPTIDCNVQQMVSLFQHIISNAIASCPIKPKVIITAKLENRMWTLCFVDNGTGVEDKYRESIFLPFNHLHSRNAHNGSGIGLATCKKIVERHQGKIWLESEAGVGSVVYVCLPSELGKPVELSGMEYSNDVAD